MFQRWRWTIREAEEALAQGRLDDAARLLQDHGLQEFLPGQRLALRVAERMAQRGLQLGSEGNLPAGWAQLERAAQLSGWAEPLESARRLLADLALRDAEDRLRAGDAAGCLARLEDLERRKFASDALGRLRYVAQSIQSAEHLAQRGRFAEADNQLATAQPLRPDLDLLEKRRQLYQRDMQRCRELTEQLHRAMGASRWNEALAVAEQLLELAPHHRMAREARKRAWAEVGAKMVDSQLVATQPWMPSSRRSDAAADESHPRDRFLLWVDAVGGFLVCLTDEIVIGQAVPGCTVDVPILGDLSRRHARIVRDAEGYRIEPFHQVRCNGRELKEPGLLHDGDELELGEGVRLRFRKPHALSASARLELVSRHRTQPWADGVLLMAESCVLGPKWHNHVVCRDWTQDVVIFRQGTELYCRSIEPVEIDGRLCEGRSRISRNSHIVGTDFSMCLEELDRCETQPLR